MTSKKAARSSDTKELSSQKPLTHVDITLEEIGAFMRTMRVQRGLSQCKVAEAIQTSQASLSRYESGCREPNVLEWFRFCQLVGIPDSFLYIGKAYRKLMGSSK